MGIVAATIANVHRDPKKGRPSKPSDFIPKFDRKPETQSWQEQLTIVERLNAAFGGKDLRGKSGDVSDSTDQD